MGFGGSGLRENDVTSPVLGTLVFSSHAVRNLGYTRNVLSQSFPKQP